MVVRRKKDLVELVDMIHAVRQEIPVVSAATDNFLLTAEMIARSALLREESRGTHYREDFPESNPDLAKPSLIRRGTGGEMEASLG